SAMLAAQFSLTGSNNFVRELAPVSPLRLILAVGYDYDARPVAPPPAPPPVAVAPPAPPKGRLLGQVTDQGAAQPIANVVVRIANTKLTPLATDVNGRFTSYELDPGEFELELSHPDYEARRCAGTIAATGGEATVACTLSAKPATASLYGTV